jgi:hypothetical protein
VPGIQGHDDRAHGLGVPGWRDRTHPRAAIARNGTHEQEAADQSSSGPSPGRAGTHQSARTTRRAD